MGQKLQAPPLLCLACRLLGDSETPGLQAGIHFPLSLPDGLQKQNRCWLIMSITEVPSSHEDMQFAHRGAQLWGRASTSPDREDAWPRHGAGPAARNPFPAPG